MQLKYAMAVVHGRMLGVVDMKGRNNFYALLLHHELRICPVDIHQQSVARIHCTSSAIAS